MKTSLGGDRVGSGKKQIITTNNFGRSTHDLGYTWRSSMSAGTLVPFMTEVGLPGDSFDIDLDCNVLTLPTNGPLFGSFKVQLDVFQVPMRLYNARLHMNELGIGMDMKNIHIPQLQLKHYMEGTSVDFRDNAQIDPSCIFSYLNIRGLGRKEGGGAGQIMRQFNAIPYLAYFDIFKNYYANKQEEKAYMIHNDLTDDLSFTIATSSLKLYHRVKNDYVDTWVEAELISGYWGNLEIMEEPRMVLNFVDFIPQQGEPDPTGYTISTDGGDSTYPMWNEEGTGLWSEYTVLENNAGIEFSGYTGVLGGLSELSQNNSITVMANIESSEVSPKLVEFDLTDIDTMRKLILSQVGIESPFVIEDGGAYGYPPYTNPLKSLNNKYSMSTVQEGLLVKTYQSDLFNNWITTEWIDGTNGINEITAIDTSSGSFTVDSLNVANKVYNMLNKIAISGGSYDDWIEAVYTDKKYRSTESPVYHGSLIKELVFQEVISSAQADGDNSSQPLGTLAGKGRLTDKHKGGKIRINVTEPSYIMGIVSLTPRIDYSQGNKWDTNLKTMDDLHKPALDQIGFEDLITDQMHWADSETDVLNNVTFNSAGKQPAWINYMTNVNQVRGNFALENKEGWMVLNRKYDVDANGITDLSTYIDPSKFNNIFADASLDAQNFWVQIGVKNYARRIMSAKVIPNL